MPICILIGTLMLGCAQNPPGAGVSPAVSPVVSPAAAAPTEAEGDELQIPNLCETDCPDEPGLLTLTMIGIGDADCFLLTLPDGGSILIDTGRKTDYNTITSLLKTRGVTSLRGLVLTHGHKDHAGGVKALLEEYPVERIYTSKLDDVTFTDKVQALLQVRGADTERLSAGDTLGFGLVQIEVLAPLHADRERENNNSLVLRVTYGDTAFLLMGDAEQQVEQELLARGTELRADVLKVGHHGEDDATGTRFLRAVSPKFAAVTGDDDKDPQTLSPVVIDRLRQENIEIFSSKDFSVVDFISNGAEVTAASVAR